MGLVFKVRAFLIDKHFAKSVVSAEKDFEIIEKRVLTHRYIEYYKFSSFHRYKNIHITSTNPWTSSAKSTPRALTSAFCFITRTIRRARLLVVCWCIMRHICRANSRKTNSKGVLAIGTPLFNDNVDRFIAQ